MACEGLHGSTLGKRICGITVVTEDLRPAGLVAALKRSVAYYLDSLFFGWIAARKMSESPRRQRHGDVWAGTMVVRIRSLDPASRRSSLRFLGAVAAGLFGDGLLVFLELAFRAA